ncbi:MAG TPA: hypothetical protein VJR47_11425 [Stellaceae bacterium]|nr:hypothetical protein [Stellaceae bacterium]
MSSYRLYLLDGQRAISAREDFTATSDDEAIECAAVVFNACSDACSGYEVWSGSRKLVGGATAISSLTVDGLRAARQERAIKIEEALRDSRWAIAQSRRLIKEIDAALTSRRAGDGTRSD